MKTATIADAESRLSALIDEVESGEQILIVRRGRPVARLVPEPSAPDEWEAVRAWVESDAAAPGTSVAELRERDFL
jgi:prevent-host-death family protein